MKNRIMVAVFGIPFLLYVLGFAPLWVPLLLVTGMCAVGAWEMMHATVNPRHKVVYVSTVAMAVVMPFLLWQWHFGNWTMLAGILAFYVVLLFSEAIVSYERDNPVGFAAVTTALFAGVFFPGMLSCLLLLRLRSDGALWVFAPLAVAFGSDTFALFAGLFFGRHKLAPKVSPKKTREGAIGGLLGGVIGMVVITFVAQLLGIQAPSYLWAVFIGLVGSIFSQVGDLSFSVVKREYGVKDYGNLLPGHGGILDRFDSVSFVAPVLWILVSLG